MSRAFSNVAHVGFIGDAESRYCRLADLLLLKRVENFFHNSVRPFIVDGTSGSKEGSFGWKSLNKEPGVNGDAVSAHSRAGF